ncbi:MAG: hypothetical protein KC616_14365 [Myxococcales bacterium]|nr:hypothetical protein [Myxococcales bacterium]
MPPREPRLAASKKHAPIVIPPALAARMACGDGWSEGVAGSHDPRRERAAGWDRDGALEAMVTILATVLFGLGWALVELETPVAGPPGASLAALQTGTRASVERAGLPTALDVPDVYAPAATARPARAFVAGPGTALASHPAVAAPAAEGRAWQADRWLRSTR